MNRREHPAWWLVCGLAGMLAAVPALGQVSATARTITVDVPANTPNEDTVYLQSGPWMVWPMTRVDADTWTLTLTESDLVNPAYGMGQSYRGPGYDPNSKILSYAFTRWGGEYMGAEALVEQLEGPFNWFNARDVAFAAGTQIHDHVERWRWSPADGAALPSYAPVLTAWKPRIDGREFQAGVWENDYWFDTMKPVVGPTALVAKHAAKANWVQIGPPWDYTQVSPLPVLSNQNPTVPAYRNEADLRTHIRESKARGLKVMLLPQICCNTPVGQTFDEAWYEQWYDQYEAFVLYHARIAAEEGVDSVALEWAAAHVQALPGYQPVFPWFEQRWRELMAKVRAVYDGPVGYTFIVNRPVDTYGHAWPFIESEPILDLFDFFNVALWAGVAVGNNDTQAEITERVRKVFDNDIRPIHEATGKPVVIGSVAYGSYDGAARSLLDVFTVANSVFYPEQDNVLDYDPIEQAMVYQAVMQTVADRPYVVGVYPFGYQYIALPQGPDYSIRGKPAEGVFAAWNELARQDVPPELEAGHSGVFYNPSRNGEGNYIEMLTDDRAVVYTFTFRPDRTGPAWFIGDGEVVGDSIVIEELLRPTGTPFGAGFNTHDIEFGDAGAMALTFSDCKSEGSGGGVVYSGSPALGYESLLTRASRLGQITGCGEPPANNAGLSGSYYDPARSGEGVVVEWLTNGQVLVVFFTYDLEGKQLWLFGIAPPAGKSVTMEALYPSSSTRWGSEFDPDEVDLDSWGTFTLTWANCDQLTFEYESVLPGFGSAARNYQRLSKLAGTSCPAFP